MMLKQVKNLFKGFTRTVDRIKIVPEKCLNDEEYNLLCRGGLTDKTIEKINRNFSRMVTEVIGLSDKDLSRVTQYMSNVLAQQENISLLDLR